MSEVEFAGPEDPTDDPLEKPLLLDTAASKAVGGKAAITSVGGHLARALQLAMLVGLIAAPAATLYHYLGGFPDGDVPAPPCVSPIVAGQVVVTIDGVPTLLTLVSSTPGEVPVSPDGTNFTVHSGARAYLVTDPCPQTFYPEMYLNSPFVLRDRQFSLSVDLSHVSCGCAGTVYFASMPAYTPNNTFNPGSSGDYSCVADTLGGCPEMDVLEVCVSCPPA